MADHQDTKAGFVSRDAEDRVEVREGLKHFLRDWSEEGDFTARFVPLCLSAPMSTVLIPVRVQYDGKRAVAHYKSYFHVPAPLKRRKMWAEAGCTPSSTLGHQQSVSSTFR